MSAPKPDSDIRLECENSAEFLVVKTSGESRTERSTEQFYRYGVLDWKLVKTTDAERKSGCRIHEKESNTSAHRQITGSNPEAG